MEIDKGRLNGLVGLASFLQELKTKGVRYELASLRGGIADNAIPTEAEAVIVIRSEDRQATEDAAATFLARLKETYKGIEDEMELTVSELAETSWVIPEADADNALRYITEVIDGVYTWSKDLPGIVESSSNLGIFSLDVNGLTAKGFERSSSPEKEEEILDAQQKLAEACGFTFTRTKTEDAWPFDPDSRLLEKAKQVYLEQNGEEIEILTLHAGLECGTFKALNPDLALAGRNPDGLIRLRVPSPHAAARKLRPVRVRLYEGESKLDVTMLINKAHPLPENFRPDGLIDMFSMENRHFIMPPKRMLLEASAAHALNQMCTAAKEEAGLAHYLIYSAWRSHEEQAKIFAAEQSAYVAIPGCSEHESGLAIDITTTVREEKPQNLKWLHENSWRFGYILRYPREQEHITGIPYEGWHFRYVGEELAALLHEKGWTLEEYYQACL